MDGLKFSDLYKGKMGIAMAVLAAVSLVMLILKFVGILDISYTIALLPIGCDILNAIIFLIVMIF